MFIKIIINNVFFEKIIEDQIFKIMIQNTFVKLMQCFYEKFITIFINQLILMFQIAIIAQSHKIQPKFINENEQFTLYRLTF